MFSKTVQKIFYPSNCIPRILWMMSNVLMEWVIRGEYEVILTEPDNITAVHCNLSFCWGIGATISLHDWLSSGIWFSTWESTICHLLPMRVNKAGRYSSIYHDKNTLMYIYQRWHPYQNNTLCGTGGGQHPDWEDGEARKNAYPNLSARHDSSRDAHCHTSYQKN